MAIILEGVDCSGKTTFAQSLSEKTGFEIVKGSSFEISKLGADGMYQFMSDLLKRKDIIIDRLYLSNIIYGEKYGYPMMTEEQYASLSNMVDLFSLVVYLHAPVGVIQYRMLKRGDDMIEIDDIEDILNRYNEALYGEFRPRTVLSIDTSLIDIDKATNMVKELYNVI